MYIEFLEESSCEGLGEEICKYLLGWTVLDGYFSRLDLVDDVEVSDVDVIGALGT